MADEDAVSLSMLFVMSMVISIAIGLVYCLVVIILWCGLGLTWFVIEECLSLGFYEKHFPHLYAEALEEQKQKRIERDFEWIIKTDLGPGLGDECMRCEGGTKLVLEPEWRPSGGMRYKGVERTCEHCDGRGWRLDKSLNIRKGVTAR